MGKKSVDSSYVESSFGDLDIPFQVQAVTPSHKSQDLRQLIVQVLISALQAQQKQGLDTLIYDLVFYVYIFKCVVLACIGLHAQCPLFNVCPPPPAPYRGRHSD